MPRDRVGADPPRRPQRRRDAPARHARPSGARRGVGRSTARAVARFGAGLDAGRVGRRHPAARPSWWPRPGERRRSPAEAVGAAAGDAVKLRRRCRRCSTSWSPRPRAWRRRCAARGAGAGGDVEARWSPATRGCRPRGAPRHLRQMYFFRILDVLRDDCRARRRRSATRRSTTWSPTTCAPARPNTRRCARRARGCRLPADARARPRSAPGCAELARLERARARALRRPRRRRR